MYVTGTPAFTREFRLGYTEDGGVVALDEPAFTREFRLGYTKKAVLKDEDRLHSPVNSGGDTPEAVFFERSQSLHSPVNSGGDTPEILPTLTVIFLHSPVNSGGDTPLWSHGRVLYCPAFTREFRRGYTGQVGGDAFLYLHSPVNSGGDTPAFTLSSVPISCIHP